MHNEIDINFEKLSTNISKPEIFSRYKDLDIKCGCKATLAEETCYAHVNKVNGEEAWRVVFFLSKNKLGYLKVDLKEVGHEDMIKTYNSQYGQFIRGAKDQNGAQIVGWDLGNGYLTTLEFAEKKGITQALWIPKEQSNTPDEIR